MGFFSKKKIADKATSTVTGSDINTSTLPENRDGDVSDSEVTLKPEECASATVSGPRDAAEYNALPADGYADFGVIRFKPIPGMQMNLPEEGNSYTPITFLIGNAALQVTVFAVPRGEDGCAQRRESIISAYAQDEAEIVESSTRYGKEIRVSTPVRTPDGRSGVGIVRIALVAGDRWVSQLVIHGAAVDPSSDAAQLIDNFIDSMIVVRGSRPYPPYAIIPPTIPAQGVAGTTSVGL